MTKFLLFLEILILLIGTLLFSSSCTAYNLLTREQMLLNEADSLFEVNNFEYAKRKYLEIRDKNDSIASPRAQFKLGYLNVHYENPFSNLNAALREFKRFTSDYPNHELVEEANTWIRILTLLNSNQKQYKLSEEQLKILNKKLEGTKHELRRSDSYDVLLEAVRKCYTEKDSLEAHIELLNEVIDSCAARNRPTLPLQ